MADRVKGVVVFDEYSYVEDGEIRSGVKGETLDVTADELKRGLDLGALAKPNTSQAKDAKTSADTRAAASGPDSSAPGIAGDLILSDLADAGEEPDQPGDAA